LTRETQEVVMKSIILSALLAFMLIGSVGCASSSPSGLYPISGTDEGTEMFKDEGSD
jgi:hypothetical protein